MRQGPRVFRHFFGLDPRDTVSQTATRIMIAVVAIESISGDRSRANHARVIKAMMPTPCESWRKPRMEYLNRMVPIKNSDGPPIAVEIVLGSDTPYGCFSTSSSATAERTMPATIGKCK